MLQKNRNLYLFILFLFSLLLAYLCIINCTPPVSRDALTHHLAVPKLYLQNGGIYEIPNMIFSYYPMNMDLLYLVSLWLGNDIVPKFIHMIFGLATSWLIYKYLKSRIDRTWGILGAFFFITVPIIIRLASSAYVDLGVTFFSTASLLLIIHWNQNPKYQILFLAGICAGLAAGTKYNGLLTVFLLTCLLPFLSSENNRNASSKIKSSLVFCSFALVAVSPWLIRNFLWTGNPVYPLFLSFFNPEQVTQGHGMNPILVRGLVYKESLVEMLLIPLRIFFEGQDHNPQYFDGVLNPFLLMFFILAIVIPKKNCNIIHVEKKLMFWFVTLFIIFAFTQRVIRIRYIAPVLPALVITCIFGIYNLKHYILTKGYQRTAILLPVLLITAALSFNANYMVKHWQTISPLHYISGKVDRAAFITRFWPEYPIIDYANTKLPRSARIHAIFLGNRGYYFDGDVFFDFILGKSLLCSQIKIKKTAIDVARYFNEIGVTHLIIRQDLFKNYCEQQLTSKESEILTVFFNDFTRFVYSVDRFVLLDLDIKNRD